MSAKKTFPEEKIRQSLIKFLKEELLYPKEMISVERSLSSFPHLKGKQVPNRRFDIAVFGTKKVLPLLIIECKAIPLNQKALDQVIGYNHLVQAPFIALANGDEVKTLVKEKDRYIEYQGLPTYEVLLSKVGKL
ncbi:MAG: hypothetical protein S4CHLAM20_03690 [Chlamydiia bacterium]|nr:hypothetical protein [Chlamydiia bacterium]